jgi:starch phosphorylase
MAAKRRNKELLAQRIHDTVRVQVDPSSIFDVHVKRIHEYKRQLLNVMRIIHEYLRLAEDGGEVKAPRTYIFSGKAAPSYWAAKQVIKLIHNVGKVVNADARVRDRMKVVFLPDYRVSLAEAIMPAADLSEQISTAGLEASGTGNMKLAMNGALTIGTLDGANIELMQEVGADNIYIFGLTAEEIATMRDKGGYHPRSLYNREPRLARVLDALSSSMFCPEQPGLFGWIYNAILDMGDRYMHLPDLLPYVDASARAEQEFTDKALWAKKAILNVARSGKFSSDRTVHEYARDVWNIQPVAPEESLPFGPEDEMGTVERPM